MKHENKLLHLFVTFLKIGTFSFGGGLAMLPLIRKEVVQKHKWVEQKEIVDILALSQSLPGVIAINSSVFIGKKVAGVKGAIVSAIAVSLPAFLSILLILSFFPLIKGNTIMQKAFTGVIAASAALIVVTAIQLAGSAIKSKAGILIAVATFILIIVFNINAMWAIIASVIIGIAVYLVNRGRKKC